MNDTETDWKVNLREKIEHDIENQVKQALDTPHVDRRWERKKANRQKKIRNLQIMKLNNLHHARPPVFARVADDSADNGFKYIDVNYTNSEKVGSFAGNKFNKLSPMKKSVSGYEFNKKKGLFRYNGAFSRDHHAVNMRGGLDLSLLDTAPSTVNFLALPKHEIPPNLRPLVPGAGLITFNGLTLPNYGASRRCFQTYSKAGLNNLLNSRNRRNKLNNLGQGMFVDKRGIVMSKHGPFWPPGYGPVCQCPAFLEGCLGEEEFGPTVDQSLKTHATNLLNNRKAGNGLDPNWKPLPQFQQQQQPNQATQQANKRHFMSSLAAGKMRQSTTIGQFYEQSDEQNSPRSRYDENLNAGHSPRGGYYSTSNHDNHNGYHRNKPGYHANAASQHNHAQKFQNLGNSHQKQKLPWRGKPVIYDCERSSRVPLPHAVPEGMSESLVFESRFESGNLRQVRRIGQFEYELVLRTDMYTKRHTQWFYFRVQKAQRNVTYKFNIINLLKKDSLYNYGMKPLVYSELLAKDEKLGWHRMGENIKYLPWSNTTRNGLLSVDLQYYNLEFNVTFDWEGVEGDSLYLAHCYPYTYTDLKRHLDGIMADPDLSQHVKREVLCETTAGNACFLLTITEFPDKEKDKYKDFHQEKKGVVVTARVHPGETQASWMMKGLIDFLTSNCRKAEQLRKRCIFKIVPMLNPDGVIVGNYRTSLAARDLNRNYRHPRQSTFPTVWHTKQMVDLFSKDHEILLYCDLHGHSRKPMVFMYGCERKALYSGNGKQNGSAQNGSEVEPKQTTRDCAKNFIEERLFPWLMHKRAPERFTFHGSKYAVRRCKESTGRVVMFRQMGIMNSFTMEASFSGTMQGKMSSGRHFNISDFTSIGQSLCESVLDYMRLGENQLLKSRVIMELTKDLAQHMIETNPDKIQNNTANVTNTNNINDKSTNNMIGFRITKHETPTRSWKSEKVSRHESSPKAASKQSIPPESHFSAPSATKTGNSSGGSSSYVQSKKSKASDVPNSKKSLSSTEETETHVPSPPPDLAADEEVSEQEEDSNLDENCYLLLEQLNFQEMTVESGTSSDSDSESDPELGPEAPPSNRQKKKKKRKKRPRYMKSVSAPSSMNMRKMDDKEEMMRPKAFPGFVNRYTHRSNGGIPIYAQERVQERAARRLAELKLAEEEKIKRQSELFTNDLSESGNKVDERSRYSEVYGIHYQLGPNPNKPQCTIFNPFRSLSPSGDNGHAIPYRMRTEAFNQSLSQTIHELGSEGSSCESEGEHGVCDTERGRRKMKQGTLDLSGTDSDGNVGSKTERASNGPKTMVPLQTCNLSLKFAGEIARGENPLPPQNRYQWVTNYEEKLLKSVKDLQWEDSSENVMKNTEKQGKNDRIIEASSKQKKSADSWSRISSASTKLDDNFPMKNIVQYEVVIGQQKYPIHIHR